jgi:hypothetical protein
MALMGYSFSAVIAISGVSDRAKIMNRTINDCTNVSPLKNTGLPDLQFIKYLQSAAYTL